MGTRAFLSEHGKLSPADKSALENLGVGFEEGGHSYDVIAQAEAVVKSPGIPPWAPIIKSLKAAGIPVISELEYAWLHSNAKVIAVTGSNGKTTTASLVHHVLEVGGAKSVLAGNIGVSFSQALTEGDPEYAVLEVSSFQLDDCVNFKPDIAIITNITPDHLDRYGYDVNQYADSKMRITQNQDEKDFLLVCTDDAISATALHRNGTKAAIIGFGFEPKLAQDLGVDLGAKATEQTIELTIKNGTMTIEDLALQGKHNVYNSMAAAIAGNLVNIRKESIKTSLTSFDSLEHRMEPVLNISGVEYINDSKATNVNATYYALECMDKDTVWIVGGVDKGNDYDELLPLVKDKVKAVVALGKDNAKIVKAFSAVVEVVETASMTDAVKQASKLANKGDVVLLSPCCASFDLFDSYEERGEQFKDAVKSL